MTATSLPLTDEEIYALKCNMVVAPTQRPYFDRLLSEVEAHRRSVRGWESWIDAAHELREQLSATWHGMEVQIVAQALSRVDRSATERAVKSLEAVAADAEHSIEIGVGDVTHLVNRASYYRKCAAAIRASEPGER